MSLHREVNGGWVHSRSFAAPGNVLIAEIWVEPDHVRVELEVGVADLPAFANLMPDPIRAEMGLEPAPLADRIARFFEEDLVVLREDGNVPGRVVGIEPRNRVRRDEITGEPLPSVGGEDETVLYLSLIHI